jgi:hypothetical protein
MNGARALLRTLTDEDQRSDLASVQLLLAELSGSQVETTPFEDQ